MTFRRENLTGRAKAQVLEPPARVISVLTIVESVTLPGLAVKGTVVRISGIEEMVSQCPLICLQIY